MRKALLLLSAVAVTASGTAVTAQYAPRSLDPSLVAEARKDNAAIIQQYGGAESGARA